MELVLLIGCLFILRQITVTKGTKSLQSCLTLRDPIDGSPPGSPVPGILQATILESIDEVSFALK